MTPQMMQQQQGIPLSSGGDMSGMNANIHGLGMGQFEQGFNTVPQDLWRMPMTLEWDWADMTGYSGYEDGISMNGVMPDFTNSGYGTSEFNNGAMNRG